MTLRANPPDMCELDPFEVDAIHGCALRVIVRRAFLVAAVAVGIAAWWIAT